MLKIKINHQEIEIPEMSALSKVLEIYGTKEKVYAVALNGKIIPRAMLNQVFVKSHDQVDVIVPMQGG
jgi:thiamine biosynthesis protein ThiS